MKIIDERETKKKQKQQRQKNKGDKCCSERVRAKRFCCAFKLGFLQLIWGFVNIARNTASTSKFKN